MLRLVPLKLGLRLNLCHRFILGVYLSRHRNMLVAEAFLKTLVEKYGKHTVYSDGASRTLKPADPQAWNIGYIHSMRRTS